MVWFFFSFFFLHKGFSGAAYGEKSCKKKRTSESAGAVEAVTAYDTNLSKSSRNKELQLWGNAKVRRAMHWF